MLNCRDDSWKFAAMCILYQIPMWAYLQGSVGAWIPRGCCRSVLQSVGNGCLPSAAELGSREQGTVTGFSEVPSGTASSSLALSRTSGSGFLAVAKLRPEYNFLCAIEQRRNLHGRGLLCCRPTPCPIV